MKSTLADACIALVLVAGAVYGQQSACRANSGSVLNYTLTSVDTVTLIPLSDYQGKVLLVFNAATY